MDTKQRTHQLRFLTALLLSCAGLIALGVHLYGIQVNHPDSLNRRGDRQHHGLIHLKPERGLIYDRHYAAMAVNSSRPCLRLQGASWEQSEYSVETLATALNVAPAELQSRVDRVTNQIKRSNGRMRSGILYFNLPETQQAAVRKLEWPCLTFSPGTGRVYPGGCLAASTLGFVGLEGQGLEGLECFGESYLQGSSSNVPTLRDGHGRNLAWTDVTNKDSCRGADMIVALDQYVQYLAEKQLDALARKYNPKWASIVVMEPHRGEILALANWPTFDPNRIEDSTAAGRKNYAVTEAFEPGSTMKTFTLAAAIEGGIVLPTTPIYCEKGRYRIHRHTVRDDVHAYEWLSVEEVLAHSSNIGAVKIAQLMGQERLHGMLRRLGFGQVTGVAFPGESPGLLRPLSRWSGLSIAAIPFGQEMQTTGLGLANAYCAIANGGLLHVPKLVLGYRNPRTGEFRPLSYGEPKRVCSSETAETLRKMLVAVTERGGGQNARVPGFRVAGKTGTAQIFDREIQRYSRTKHVASFIGLLPAESPRVVVAVVVNQPQGAKYGNQVAAPAFAALATELMNYLKVFPSDPDAGRQIVATLFPNSNGMEPNGLESRAVPAVSGEISQPLVVGMTMREAYEHLRGQGVPLRFQGSGVALLQEPRGFELEDQASPRIRQVEFFPPARLAWN